MVDYADELKRLRDMHDNFLLRYGSRIDHGPTDDEIRDAKRIKLEIDNLWHTAVKTRCEKSEDELVVMESVLEVIASRRKYKF